MNGIKLNKETIEKVSEEMWNSGGEPLPWCELTDADEPLKKELRRMAKAGIKKYLELVDQ